MASIPSAFRASSDEQSDEKEKKQNSPLAKSNRAFMQELQSVLDADPECDMFTEYWHVQQKFTRQHQAEKEKNSIGISGQAYPVQR